LEKWDNDNLENLDNYFWHFRRKNLNDVNPLELNKDIFFLFLAHFYHIIYY